MSSSERALVAPEVEVVAKASRRRFTQAYKRKFVRDADGCRTAGAVGAPLRREGLYSSHLTTWRAARRRGKLVGAPKKRGPAPPPRDPRDEKIAALEREAAMAGPWQAGGRKGTRSPTIRHVGAGGAIRDPGRQRSA